MITLNAELNGVKVSKQIPTSWQDVTFSQYLDILRLNGNELQLLSIFTGIDDQTLAKAKINGLETILIALDFMKEPPQYTESPELFMGELMPKDITFQSLGPYIDCKNILGKIGTDNIVDFVGEYPKYCAIYLQAIKANWVDYDYDKAMELVPEIMNQPAWEVVGLGNVFITKLYPLKKNTESNSPQVATHRKKSKLGTKS